MTYSKHWANDRKERQAFIERKIGWGTEIDRINFKNKRGEIETHIITSTALLLITVNDNLITVKIPRPGQLRRCYAIENREPPEELLIRARQNYNKGFNNI